MTRQETVWVTASNGRTRYYHTNQDCFKLQNANSVQEWTRESLAKTNRELCSICENNGEQIKNNTQGSGHYESLLNAAKEAQG